MILTVALYLLLGLAAGFVAGLFGIGGGLLIVPVLVISFTLQGMPVDVLTHAAVGTSLATIVFTSISSVIAHHKKGAVRWSVLPQLSGGILAGAFAGVWIAAWLSGPALQIIIGIFAVMMALQMWFSLKPSGGTKQPGNNELVAAGGGIGCASAVFGIGGGSLSVPYLTWRGFPMQQAVATSSACGVPIAVMGALGNIWTGWGEADLPAMSLGYIYLPAFFGIVIASTFSAKYGALLAHRLDQKKLKRIFAVFLLIVGSRFLLTNLF